VWGLGDKFGTGEGKLLGVGDPFAEGNVQAKDMLPLGQKLKAAESSDKL
jgi:hypothetical protein